ncbi:glutathione transferase GST 23-like [Coffea eugenioides]|uniref:Probable glutathione S-transferase n=1 Tax=Coffea arabica TaxID=13443 RepID=A0A6P6UGF3_COFAR|nr:glutathione transferase GST 23-like [Coffea arabica]XP_027148541.1 glutathione transferase GST 23-like [Coffea eugenioides]
MAGEGVKLLGYWASPYALRVRSALKLKAIEYEYQEEDLENKSPLLLQGNPVYKKVPVLLHNGKSISESLVILEYIDEVWKHNPLLPEDPYERVRSRFWAKFVDEKCVPALVGIITKVGEELEKSAREARELLKTLESGLDGKRCFGGTKIGFADVAIAWVAYWVRMEQEAFKIQLIDQENMPLLAAWIDYVLEDPVMKEFMPPYDKLVKHTRGLREKLTAVVSN